MKTRRLLLALTAVATAAATGLLFGLASPAVGKGKPGGAAATGEIYFETYVAELEETRLAVMSPDGIDRIILPGPVPSDAQPSYGLHDGNRWHLAFTEIPGAFHPDGQPRGILEAVREDGGARVALVDDLTMFLNWDFRWSKDDASISFAGYRWDLSVEPPQVAEAGLYVVPVEFDADGPSALAPPELMAAGDVTLDVHVVPTILRHDWSPDGSRIVFQRSREGETGSDLFLVDLNSGNVSLLALWGWEPSWSPDGQRIAFASTRRDGDQTTIEAIQASDTDESSRAILFGINSVKGFTLRILDGPHWSPTGSHLAFRFFQLGGGDETFKHVYRMTDAGRDVVDLTPDIPGATLRGWR